MLKTKTTKSFNSELNICMNQESAEFLYEEEKASAKKMIQSKIEFLDNLQKQI